ncbi:MAG: phosphoribosylformylglycinamidine synthase subunit PurS, partial [Proteobacteria bacterium]|nr:phosphoribosylformylglycinamidine synthase subunit PurS [Pseudomonadota bacterium]
MAQRVEVGMKGHLRDARGEGVAREVREFLHRAVEEVRTLDVYTLDLGLTAEEAQAVAREPLSDPVIQEVAAGGPLALRLYPAFHWAVEVGFLPGVTDNVGRTAKEAVEFFLGRSFPHERQVYTAVQFLLRGEDLTRAGLEAIVVGLLANPLIQYWEILSREEFGARGGFGVRVPRVREVAEARVEAVDLEVSDAELLRLSKERLLALTLDEMEAIRGYYRDEGVRTKRAALGLPEAPTDVELECLAQTWSEHCKHKIFNATIHYDDGSGEPRTVRSLFKTYIVGATERVRKGLGARDYCLSVFVDNAGVIAFEDEWSLCFKVETHN